MPSRYLFLLLCRSGRYEFFCAFRKAHAFFSLLFSYCSFSCHPAKRIFVDDGDAEILCLCELGACFFSRNHICCFGGNGGGCFSAVAFDHGSCFIAGKCGERSCDDKGHAFKGFVSLLDLISGDDTAAFELFDEILGLRMRKIRNDAICGDLAEVGYGDEIFFRSICQSVDIAKGGGKSFCGFFTDIADAERIDQAIKTCLFGAFDCRDQIVCGFFAHAFKVLQLICFQMINVRNIFDKSGINALQFGSVVFGFEGYIPIIENRLVIVPQLYGSFLFGKGATNGLTEGWNPMFNGPVPSYPHMNNILGGAEMGRHIDHQLPFIGLNRISFAFNNLAIVRADVRVRVHKNHYLTAMVNYGRSGVDIKNFFKQSDTLLWSDLYDYNASNWWGAGVRYSIDTKVGPLNFDISTSNISRNVNLYFSFGYYF